MGRTWYRLCHWLCGYAYYDRITVNHRERLPAAGPVLYLGTHRNGAVDGFVYHQMAPRSEFLISTQLLRSTWARVFFHGIPVARDKDGGDYAQHEAALVRCREYLAAGGELFVLPEGTSSLGPHHLPFKSGAARIALDCLAHGVPLTIVPVALHYERAWAFRSRVEIEVGPPIATVFDPAATPVRRLHEMRRRISAALEAVGVNFKSASTQDQVERLAYAATLGTRHSYGRVLKLLEPGLPASLLALWQKLEPDLIARRVWRHQGVPLFPKISVLPYALVLAVLGPILLAGIIANAPPLFAGWLAARKLADDRNVVALWRILVGLPLFALWFLATTTALSYWAGPLGAVGYAAVTFGAVKAWYRAKKLAVAVGNAVRHPDLAPRAQELHEALLLTLGRISAATRDTAPPPCGAAGGPRTPEARDMTQSRHDAASA